jgi:uncharacterized protein
MPVDPELLAILACPECKTPVVPVKDGAGLKCEKCKRVYPVKDDIPVMLLDEATVEPRYRWADCGSRIADFWIPVFRIED